MKFIMAGVLALVGVSVFAGNPAQPMRGDNITQNVFDRSLDVGVDPSFSQSKFRAAIIGDSQTTTASGSRITTHYHAWKGPHVGEFIASASNASGSSIANISTDELNFRFIDPDNNWSNGGANDHWSSSSAEWEVISDVPYSESFIGRYRIIFDSSNSNSPWNYNWTQNQDLVFRIAVRSGPDSVPAIELRPDRTVIGNGTVFEISPEPGIQIFEISVPSSLNSNSNRPGGVILFPDGYVEEAGQYLQILGAYIGIAGDPDGLVIGYQGDSGWNMNRHLTMLSQESRVRLVEMLHLDTMILFQGHNREWDNQSIYPIRANILMNVWDEAFQQAGYNHPKWILVEPWSIFPGSWDAYGDLVHQSLYFLGRTRSNAKHVNYNDIFYRLGPDVYDPSLFDMDNGSVHPTNVMTARRLMDILESLIFE